MSVTFVIYVFVDMGRRPKSYKSIVIIIVIVEHIKVLATTARTNIVPEYIIHFEKLN
jgi:hypothetical protein